MATSQEETGAQSGRREREQPESISQVMNLIWLDEDEVTRIGTSSRFPALREQLNSGKVTINLGILKYEVGGARTESNAPQPRHIAKEIFLGTKATTVVEFHKLLRSKIEEAREGFWESALVVIDGELNIPLQRRYTLSSLLKRICSHLGYVADGQPNGPATEKQYHEAFDVLMNLAIGYFGQKDVTAHLQAEFDASKDDVQRIDHAGKSLIQGIVVGSNSTDENQIKFVVGLPLESLRHLPYPTGMKGRILGWLEHAKENVFYVRAIAMARVDVLSVTQQ